MIKELVPLFEDKDAMKELGGLRLYFTIMVMLSKKYPLLSFDELSNMLIGSKERIEQRVSKGKIPTKGIGNFSIRELRDIKGNVTAVGYWKDGKLVERPWKSPFIKKDR